MHTDARRWVRVVYLVEGHAFDLQTRLAEI
jgi:hypothetical protein